MWAVWVVVVCGVQLWRLNHFAYMGFDLAIYTQTFWNFTHGGGFFSSIQDHNYLSDHLEPILLVFWPFMKLWFSPLWLLWGQTLVLASSIFPLYRLTRRVLPERQALILPVLFLLHTTVWNAATIEFHALALAMPLILWVCVLLEEGKARWWWLTTLILLALVREEMGVVVIGFGLLAVIKKRSWKWWLPALVIGATWTGLAHWIQSWFVDSYRYTHYFPWIDLLRNGYYAQALKIMVDLIFRVYVLKMFVAPILALGIVWVLDVVWLIPAIPVILSFALLDAGVSNAFIEGYHATVPFTLIWAALPLGLQRAQKVLKRFLGPGIPVPYGLLLGIVAPAMLSTWLVLWWQFPKGSSEYQPEDIQILLDQVGTDGVAASAAFLPQLANRPNLQASWYVFRGQDEFLTSPYILSPETQWLLLDTNEFLDLRTQRDEFWTEHQQFVELLQKEFTPATSVGSVVLFERNDFSGGRSTFQQLMPYASGTPDAIPQNLTDAYSDRPLPVVLPGDNFQVLGNHLYIDLYISNPSRWKHLEEQFITPVINVKQGSHQLTIPLGYGLVTPETVQTGDRMRMDVVLPERMLRAGRLNLELQITAELIELKGLSYGRYQSIIHRTRWVETFLDKTLTIE